MSTRTNKFADAKSVYSTNQLIEHHNVAVKIPQSFYQHKDVDNFNSAVCGFVTNTKNWKLATKPIWVRTRDTAEKVAAAIAFFMGGAEIDEWCSNSYVVTSKGYYYYVGA